MASRVLVPYSVETDRAPPSALVQIYWTCDARSDASGPTAGVPRPQGLGLAPKPCINKNTEPEYLEIGLLPATAGSNLQLSF